MLCEAETVAEEALSEFEKQLADRSASARRSELIVTRVGDGAEMVGW
jgi:hypothetical protein